MLTKSLARGVAALTLAVLAFTLGATLRVTPLGPNEARADTPRDPAGGLARLSSIQVPPEGLTFRSPDGRVIARLSYDARGGVFEVLGERGDAVASMGRSSRAGFSPASAAAPGPWSIDDAPDDLLDPWSREPSSPPGRPGSGL
jgi:hypothetical protein